MVISVAVVGRITGLAWLLLAVLLQGAFSFALRPDPRLLSLVPPDSQIVAGVVAPLRELDRGNFLVFTRANTLDLEDFFSIVGADATREIREFVFAASPARGGVHPEHSLLVSGHFESRRISQTVSPPAVTSLYRGVPVLVLDPFDRERGLLDHDRWLAIIDSRLAIFGAVLSVRQEIDRYLDRTEPAVWITQQLGLLRDGDETWCLISSLALGSEVQKALRDFDPAFSEIKTTTGSLLFGIRYGRQVEFEYLVDGPPEPVSSVAPARFFTPAGAAQSLVADSATSPLRKLRRVVRLTRQRYSKLLSRLATR